MATAVLLLALMLVVLVTAVILFGMVREDEKNRQRDEARFKKLTDEARRQGWL